MSIVADLHTHSTSSDGLDAPTHVVERAAALGLRAIALTDHDTVAGIGEAQVAGVRLGVEVLAGTELTCYADGRELHILGLNVDPRNPALVAHAEHFHTARFERARLISEALEREGVPIDIEAVMRDADGGSVGRIHIAKALLAAGHVATWDEAFKRYLGDGRPANVPKPDVSPEEVIALINNAGGSAFFAHPELGDQYHFTARLKAAGLAGIEVFHSCHSREAEQKCLALAYQHGLLVCGGSDCHGALKGRDPLLGNHGLDESRWQTLRRKLR